MYLTAAAIGATIALSAAVTPITHNAAAAPASALCSVAGMCGEVVTPYSSRGSSIAVKNWRWPQYSQVTDKSVPAADRFLVRPGHNSNQQWPDTDGVIARRECSTVANVYNKLVGRWQPTRTLTPGWAYKIGDNEKWVVTNSGPNCRG